MLVRAEQLELPMGGAEEKREQPPKRNAVMAKAAARRMYRLSDYWDDYRGRNDVLDVDQRTSMDDARIALCAAEGVALDDIDSASGHDLSRCAYESVRASWRYHVKEHGWSPCYRRDYEELLAYWSERRPGYTEGDDWLAGLLKPEEEM